jgi:RND family efflux transporter MFP subunit
MSLPALCRRTALFCLLFVTGFVQADDSAILGYVEPYKTITVSSGEGGVIAEMLVEEGAFVKKGQVLARLDTAALQADLDMAKAEAKLQTTRQRRLEELAAANRSTPEELDRSKTDLIVKEAAVRKIEAQIESRTMRTPVDGVVTEVKRDLSESVSAANPHVLTVVQVDKLLVNLYLPPARAIQFQAAGPAKLRLLDENCDAPAIVEFVSPVTDSASGTVRVKFAIDNVKGKHRSGGRCTLAEP